jgi:hypothetical protein
VNISTLQPLQPRPKAFLSSRRRLQKRKKISSARLYKAQIKEPMAHNHFTSKKTTKIQHKIKEAFIPKPLLDFLHPYSYFPQTILIKDNNQKITSLSWNQATIFK